MEMDYLSSGTHGTIYKHSAYSEMVIKIPSKKISDNGLQYTVINEVHSLLSLKNNDNIIQLHNIVLDNQIISLYLEKYEEDLYNFMKKRHKLDLYQIGKILMEDITRGLYIVHTKGWIHCDVKPDNILVKHIDGKYVFCLADFGSSQIFDVNMLYYSHISVKGYRPPECLNSDNKFIKLTQKADVFSAGCVFYDFFYANNLEWKKLEDNYLTVDKFHFGFNRKRYPDIIDTELLLKNKTTKLSANIYRFMNSCLKINVEERFTSTDMYKYLNLKTEIVHNKLNNINRGAISNNLDIECVYIGFIWIIKYSVCNKFTVKTALLALDLVQRLCHTYRITLNEYTVVVLCSLLLSSKSIEPTEQNITNYLSILSDDNYTKENIIKKELEYYKKLNYVIFSDEFIQFYNNISNEMNYDKLLNIYEGLKVKNTDPGTISYFNSVWY